MVQKYEPQRLRQVVSPTTDKQMVDILKTVVSPEGTAPGAAMQDYIVGRISQPSLARAAIAMTICSRVTASPRRLQLAGPFRHVLHFEYPQPADAQPVAA